MRIRDWFRNKGQKENDKHFKSLSGELQPYRDAYEVLAEIKKANSDELVEIERKLLDRLTAVHTEIDTLSTEVDTLARLASSVPKKVKPEHARLVENITAVRERIISKHNQFVYEAEAEAARERIGVSDRDIEEHSSSGPDTMVGIPVFADETDVTDADIIQTEPSNEEQTPPELPPDIGELSIPDNGAVTPEREPKTPKEILKSLHGISEYYESSQILSFEDPSLQPVDMGGVPDNFELKSSLRTGPYGKGGYVSFDYAASGQAAVKAMFVIDFNNKNEITRIEGRSASQELNFDPIVVTENPLENFAKTFQEFCEALEPKTQPAPEPDPGLPPAPVSVAERVAAAARIAQHIAEKAAGTPPPDSGPSAPPAPTPDASPAAHAPEPTPAPDVGGGGTPPPDSGPSAPKPDREASLRERFEKATGMQVDLINKKIILGSEFISLVPGGVWIGPNAVDVSINDRGTGLVLEINYPNVITKDKDGKEFTHHNKFVIFDTAKSGNKIDIEQTDWINGFPMPKTVERTELASKIRQFQNYVLDGFVTKEKVFAALENVQGFDAKNYIVSFKDGEPPIDFKDVQKLKIYSASNLFKSGTEGEFAFRYNEKGDINDLSSALFNIQWHENEIIGASYNVDVKKSLPKKYSIINPSTELAIVFAEFKQVLAAHQAAQEAAAKPPEQKAERKPLKIENGKIEFAGEMIDLVLPKDLEIHDIKQSIVAGDYLRHNILLRPASGPFQLLVVELWQGASGSVDKTYIYKATPDPANPNMWNWGAPETLLKEDKPTIDTAAKLRTALTGTVDWINTSKPLGDIAPPPPAQQPKAQPAAQPAAAGSGAPAAPGHGAPPGPEAAPVPPPAPEKKSLDFQMVSKEKGTFQYKGGEAQLAIPGFAISDYKVEPNGNIIVAFKAKPDNHRPEYVRAVLEPTPDETKDRLIKKISLYKITPDTHGGHHDKKELIESSVDKAIKNAGVLTETFEVIGSLVNFNDVYPRLKHGHGDHGHGHGDHGHDDGKGPTSGLNTPGSKDKPKPVEAHKPKEEEKPKAPEKTAGKEFIFENGAIYYDGKRVDFAVKGFKILGVTDLQGSNPGKGVWLKPEKGTEEKYILVGLYINPTDPLKPNPKTDNKIWFIDLLKKNDKEAPSSLHKQQTDISTAEELTTVLGSLARLVERTNPLGLPEEKVDKKDSAHGGGGHGHDHGKPSPKAPALRTEQKWKENKFGSEPVLNLNSDLFYLLMKKENNSGYNEGIPDDSGLSLGREMSAVYRLLINGDERAAERRFKEMFDDFDDADGLQKKIDELYDLNPRPDDFDYRMDRLRMLQQTMPQFIQALIENRTTLADFKAGWNKENGLWKDVFEVMQKATAADRATELAARADSLDAVSGQVVKGYTKKALARGTVLLVGGTVGHYVGDALNLDALDKEFMAGARAGGAAAAHRLATNRWGAVAEMIGNVGEDDIQGHTKKVKKERLEGLDEDMENNADFHDYKMRSMSKWLSQGLRNATVKRAKEHANLEAGLDKNDDPNLYLMKIEAAEALRHEYREQGELGKARLADLDSYVNKLNQMRFTAKLNFEDRGKKKFEKDAGKVHGEVKTSAGGKNDGKGVFQLANEKLKSGYLWARSFDKKLRNKGDIVSIGLGIALGVAVSTAMSPLRRTIMTLSGMAVGGEIGAHLDAEATVRKINKETEKTMEDVKKLVDSLKSKRVYAAPNRPDTENFGAIKRSAGFFEKRKMKRASKKVEALRPEMDSLKEPVNDGDGDKFNQEMEEYNKARENQLSEKIIDLEVALLSGKLNPALELEVQDVILNAREINYFKADKDDPKKRVFNLERLAREKGVVAARVEDELKRLAAPTRGARKIIGIIAGGITGFFVGGIGQK